MKKGWLEDRCSDWWLQDRGPLTWAPASFKAGSVTIVCSDGRGFCYSAKLPVMLGDVFFVPWECGSVGRGLAWQAQSSEFNCQHCINEA